MAMEAYFEKHGTAIMNWVHMRSRCKCTLEEVLRYIHDSNMNVQIIYANHPSVTKTSTFDILMSVIRNKSVWAINLGEAEFSLEQCNQLTSTLHDSNIAFMFVDAILVGKKYVRLWKDIIRQRRRTTVSAHWLYSENEAQNHIIRCCKNMWWTPVTR